MLTLPRFRRFRPRSLWKEEEKQRVVERQASLVMGKEMFLSMPNMIVPDAATDGGSPLTYGWVLQINLFLRQLLTSLWLPCGPDKKNSENLKGIAKLEVISFNTNLLNVTCRS
jgi:hypothetical protein